MWPLNGINPKQGFLGADIGTKRSYAGMGGLGKKGAGSVTFRNHAYELHRRHRPQILIIVEPHIAEERAQAVILLVSPEAYDCYGMKVPLPPSKWKFSPTWRIAGKHWKGSHLLPPPNLGSLAV
nr:hypothetical protein CFP56_29151 [Quercus suber]